LPIKALLPKNLQKDLASRDDEPIRWCREEIITYIRFLPNISLMRVFLRAKIHKAIVTDANLEYVGSITIDKTLMDLVDISEHEKVLVVSNTSGVRLETYVIV